MSNSFQLALPPTNTREKNYIGLMSGTSMDGLDGVLVSFEEGQPTIHASAYRPYPEPFRDALSTLLVAGNNELKKAAELGYQHSKLATGLVRELLESADPSQVAAIGSHGQTVRHEPRATIPYTIQIGNGALLAELSGLTTINDFRSRDIAAGGEGAPLVPAFHQQVFQQQDACRAIVNIGGIANVTLLSGAQADKILGFDTGPGNTLMDRWVQAHKGQAFDRNGRWAQSGQINQTLLATLLSEPYFGLLPPKSTGLEQFNLSWLRAQISTDHLKPEDLQATLAALTAKSIVTAIDAAMASFPDAGLDGIYLCGGGARNHHLVSLISAYANCPVDTTAALGVDPQLLEATAFAWLARQTLLGLPGNLPLATGAQKSVVLGSIHPGPAFR